MELFGLPSRHDKGVHQRLHYLVTRQFNVCYQLALVYLAVRHLGAMVVGVAQRSLYVLYERPVQPAGKYVLLVPDKGFHTRMFQLSDGAGTHIHHLLVLIRNAFFPHLVYNMLPVGLAKEAQQQLAGLSKR